MEKLYPSNKVRFRHLYDKTDKEEQILFYRCSLMVETYIKIHVRNQEDVYNLRQEVLLKVVEDWISRTMKEDVFFNGQ